ncbi:MAG TPA: recombinase family protein [Tepidisphaeraceae bacterium]
MSVFSRAPFGYRYVERRLAGAARFEIIPEEAETARMIYQGFVRDGMAISAICKWLNREGRPTRTRKGLWLPSAVWGVLKHPAYTGHAKFGRTRVGERHLRTRGLAKRSRSRRGGSCHATATHEQIEIRVPAIIDDESFRLAQERLEENRRRSRAGQGGPRHLLQGLVVCRQCGRSLVHHPSAPRGRAKFFYYRCTGLSTHRWGGLRVCNSRAVRAEHLEQAVWADVRNLLADPQRLRREYERRLSCIDPSLSAADDVARRMAEKAERGL